MEHRSFAIGWRAQGGSRGLAANHVLEGIDLNDGILIDEARRLKRTRYRGPGWRVHILTKDRNMKARKPDNESDAYLG